MKKIGFTIAAIVVMLAFTNPTLKQFEEFKGKDSSDPRRINNFLIFSRYQNNFHVNGGVELGKYEYYTAIFGNFIYTGTN